MANNGITVKLNPKGIAQYLKSKSVADELERRANNIRNKAGEGYTVDTFTGYDRARAEVRTTNIDSRIKESRNGNLRRAIGGE